jgi:hypothetical protein
MIDFTLAELLTGLDLEILQADAVRQGADMICLKCNGVGSIPVVHHPESLGPHAIHGVVEYITCRECGGSSEVKAVSHPDESSVTTDEAEAEKPE